MGEAAAGADETGPRLRLSGAEWLLLLVLFAVQFTHNLDFIIIMPLGPEFMRELAIDKLQFGLMVSSYGFAACLSGLLAARFLDRFDRRKALLVLYAGFTVGTLLCGVAHRYWMLVVARTVAGAFGGVSAATVMVIIGDAFPYRLRGRATGVVMTAFSLTMIAGIPAGLEVAGRVGWRMTFGALGLLSAGVLSAGAAILPPLRGHLAGGRRAPANVLAVATDPTYARAYLFMVSLVLGTTVLFPFLPTYIEWNVGRPEADIKWIYVCGGAITLLTVTFFGWLSDRFGKLPVFRALALFTIVPTLLTTNLAGIMHGFGLSVLPLTWVLAVTTLLMVTTSGRMVPAMAMITASAAPRNRGSFMSVIASVQQASFGLAAVIAGLILGDTAAGAPLAHFEVVGLLGASFTLLSVFLAGRLRADAAGLGAVDMVSPHPKAEGVPVLGAEVAL